MSAVIGLILPPSTAFALLAAIFSLGILVLEYRLKYNHTQKQITFQLHRHFYDYCEAQAYNLRKREEKKNQLDAGSDDHQKKSEHKFSLILYINYLVVILTGAAEQSPRGGEKRYPV